MKKYALSILLATAMPSLAAPVLSIQPPSAMRAPGDIFSLQIAISGAVNLISYQVNVGFDPTVLQAGSVTFGPFLQSAGSTITAVGGIDNTLGLIDSLSEVLISGSKSGDGVLASLTFQAIGQGVSPIRITNPILLDDTFGGVMATVELGSVSVGQTEIPEPGTLIPVGLLLALLMLCQTPPWPRLRIAISRRFIF